MANYRELIGWIRKWEGGLSNDPRDTAPASYPAPCTYRGQTGWHTNKGITYATFKRMAALGYTASCENFIFMPDAIWRTIYKRGFWDKFRLDEYKSQSVADVLIHWMWSSGIAGSFGQLRAYFMDFYGIDLGTLSAASVERMMKEFNRITKTPQGEKIAYQRLLYKLRRFYVSLNRPEYITGWLNRVNDLEKETSRKLKGGISKAVIIGSGLIAAAFILFYKNSGGNEPEPEPERVRIAA